MAEANEKSGADFEVPPAPYDSEGNSLPEGETADEGVSLEEEDFPAEEMTELLEDEEEFSEEEERELPAPPEPTPEPEPEAAAPATATAPEPEPPPPVPETVEEPKEPEPAPQPTAEVPAPPTQEEVAQQRENWIVDMAASTYAMTEDQGRELLTSPETALPRIAAQLHASVYEQMMAATTDFLRQTMPGFVSQIIDTQADTKKHTTAFYEMWPELNEDKYKATVDQMAGMYRSSGRGANATPDQFYQDVGLQVWLALGLPREKLITKFQDPPPPQQQPAPPAAQPNAGFNPAPEAPSQPAPRNRQEGNVFEQLAEEILRDGI